MLIYENSKLAQENSSSREKAEITLSDGLLTIILYKLDNHSNTYLKQAEDVLNIVENNYSSWYFVTSHKFNTVTGRFVKIHPFTFASKIPLNVFDEVLIGTHVANYFQIDIGNFNDGDSKIAIKTLRIPAAQINFQGFSSQEVVTYSDEIVTPRKYIWDRYALQVGEQLAGCDNNGTVLLGQSISLVQADCYDLIIKKYTPGFESPLNREVDNETVFIETTGGILNTTRMELINGIGTCKFFPLGYVGKLKLKLGWRYFSGWSEYQLTIQE